MDYSSKEETIEYIFEKIRYLILPSESNNYKSKFLQSNTLLYCVVLLLVLKIIMSSLTINFPQNIFFADITKFSLENFVNQTRQSMGLQPLTENEKLNQAARLKAENMVQNQYFNHTSPSGVSPWFWFFEAGYNYKYAGENLAIGFYDSQEVYEAWLNSPSHKENIVNPNYTEVGTAVMSGFGPNNTTVVVQEFGTQLSVKPAVVNNNNLKPVVTQSQPETNPVVKTTGASSDTNIQTSTGLPEEPLHNSENEKVLSQSTESQVSIESSSGNGLNNLSSRIANFVLYNYNELLQSIIYGVSLLVIGVLFTLIFFNFNVDYKKELVFRAILIIALLSVATLINKEIIISLIPHQVTI